MRSYNQSPRRPPRKRWLAAMAVVCATIGLAACSSESPAELITAARELSAKGDQATAVIQLKKALQADPRSAPARLLLGQLLLATGDFAGAVVELEKAQAAGSAPSDVAPALARAIALAGDRRRVISEFSAVKLDDPGSQAELNSTLAAAYIAENQVDKAVAVVDEALRLAPKTTSARILKIRLLAGSGDRDGAVLFTDALLKDQPGLAEGWQLKGELLAARPEDRQAAIDAFETALRNNPRHIEAHMALLADRLEQRDIPGFRQRLAALQKVHPQHPETRFHEAQLALLEGRIAAAREASLLLLRSLPDSPRALQLAGSVELQAGSLVLAETHLAKAVQLGPTSLGARVLLAQTYLRLAQPDRALATLQPLLSSNAAPPVVLSLAAQAQMQAGDLNAAEQLFRRAAEASPDDSRPKTALAMAQMRRGNVDAGLAQLETLASDSKDTYADLALVSARLRMGQPDQALAAIDRLAGKLPKSGLPEELRGQALLRKGDVDAAKRAFEAALAAEPAYFPAMANLVRLDAAQKKRPEAIKRLEDYLKTEPRNYQALAALTRLQLQAGMPADDVRKTLEDAVARHPVDSPARLLLVDFLIKQRAYPAALTAAQQAVAALQGNYDMLDALGRAQLAAGDTQQALNTLGQVATAQPGSTVAHMRLAEAHLGMRGYGAAQQSLRRVLEIDPRHLAAQNGLIQVALAEKRTGDALAIARTVQQQRPQELVGYQMEADIQLGLQKPDLAAATLRTAFERRPETETAVRYHQALLTAGRRSDADRHASAWLQRHPTDGTFATYLGNAAASTGDFPAAERLFRQVLQRAPDNGNAMNNLAFALARQNKPESLELARRASARLPGDPRVLDTLASALALSKQLPDAIAAQRRAVAEAGDAPIYRLHLAELLVQAGDKEAAKQELEALRRLGGRFEQSARVNELMGTLQ